MFSIKQLHLDRPPANIFWHFGLAVSILLGLLIRINGIWNIPLAVDEFYFVKAVENVLKNGLPQYDTGGYYTRGILLQYILAFVSLIWDARVELSYRLVTIFLNLLAIPAVFKLSRKIAGNTVAYVVTILFCFSVWEIEFSRFIRMYSFFQTVFIWYVYLLYLITIENRIKLLRWLYLISFMSIFIYEGCVFLLVLNFLPFFFQQDSRKSSYLALSLLLLMLGAIFVSVDFRHIGVENYLPPDVILESESFGPILIPLLLLQSFLANAIWLIPFLLPLGLTGFILYRLFQYTTIEKSTKLSLSLLLVLSILNLFGLLIFLFVLFTLFQWIKNEDLQVKKLREFGSGVIFNLIFWVSYIFASSNWSTFFVNTKISQIKYSVMSQLNLQEIEQIKPLFSLKKAVFLLFNYPHFYDIIIKQFLEAVPIYSALLLMFLSGYLFLFFIEKRSIQLSSSAFLISIVLLMVIGVSSLSVPYNTTRYSFFFFPLVIIIVVSSIHKLSQKAFTKKRLASSLFGLIVVGFVVFSEDFNLNHLLHSGSKEIYLRMDYNEKLGAHYYTRNDASSPAEIVNSHLKNEDIVITTVHQSEYYLKKLDYFYVDYINKRLSILSVENGTRELWTNARLLCHEKDLFEVIKNSPGNAWMIVEAPKEQDDSVEAQIATVYQNNLFYKSLDGRVYVYRIQRKDMG